jgi:hypothetical protein
MAADDFQNPPSDQGFPSEIDPDSPYVGNRPASGARRATPGEVLTQGFQGAQNAGDFLGLDEEFTGQDTGSGYGEGLDLVPPPGTYDPSQVLEPAPMPEGDPVQEFAEAPSAFEFGEDLGSDEVDAGLFEEPAPSKTPMLVAALAVAARTAAGVRYGPKLYSSLTSGNEIPRSVAVQPRTPPKGAPGTTDPAPTPIDTPVATVTDPASTVIEQPVVTPEIVEPETTFDPSVPLLGAADPAPVKPNTALLEPLLGAVENLGAPRVEGGTFPDLDSPEYAWTTSDPLELIWRGSAVPLEAVHAPVKTLMPRIGAVRVFTTTGDIFDGRLYAVGENRVWIDAAPGRIGIDGDLVEKIEVLPRSPEGQAPGEVQIAGGKRVRASVPGGHLYGRVLKTEGDEVLLVLDDGGKVRVKTSDVEDLGTGRVAVVGR